MKLNLEYDSETGTILLTKDGKLVVGCGQDDTFVFFLARPRNNDGALPVVTYTVDDPTDLHLFPKYHLIDGEFQKEGDTNGLC
jgi:hypothetical protein